MKKAVVMIIVIGALVVASCTTQVEEKIISGSVDNIQTWNDLHSREYEIQKNFRPPFEIGFTDTQLYLTIFDNEGNFYNLYTYNSEEIRLLLHRSVKIRFSEEEMIVIENYQDIFDEDGLFLRTEKISETKWYKILAYVVLSN